MKTIPRLVLAAAVAAAVIPACRRADDPAARIARLERQRDVLTAEIESLKAGSASTSNPAAARVEAPVPVRIETVVPAPFRHYIAVQGVVESDNNILVPPLSPGIVKKIHVKTGDRVARGRLLAELDAAVLESGIAEVEQALGLAATIYERRARLWSKKIGSEIEYLQAKNGKEALEKKLDTLREQLQLTRIVSPIDGTVDEVLVKEGEMAPAGMGAIRIVQLSRLKVKAALAENYIGRVRPGDPVRIAIPVLGLEIERTVDAVSQVVDPRNRTFQIEASLPAGHRDLKPNLLAVLTVNDYVNPEALTVPRNVVQETGTERFLFVAVEENGGWVARKRAVRIGEDYAGRVEILEGLAGGERVVTLGFQRIGDGQSVAPDGEAG